MRKQYTEAEINKVRDLRAQKKTWAEVATAVGRNQKSVYSKFFKMGETKVKRGKYKKQAATIVATSALPSRHRPMVALVGEPNEIATSLRELFS